MGRIAKALAICCVWAGVACAQSNLVVYDDALQNGWQNWSWATVSLSATTPVHSGAKAISVTASNWSALYLATPAINTGSYTSLTFWVHGGSSGGQPMQIQGTLSGNPQAAVALTAPAAGAWQQRTVSLTALGVANSTSFDGFWIQVTSGGAVPTFYVDDIRLLAGPQVPPGTSTPVTVMIDAAAGRHAIDPRIYGICFGDSNQLRTLNAPLNRSGGNSTSRYNWQTNATNHGMDWYFESLAETSAAPGASADDFVRDSRSGGAQPMLSVPINGWVARLGPGRARLCSYSIAKYGAQTDSDASWFPDAGNGVRTSNGLDITNNDPADANMAVTSAFQASWLRHLTNLWGTASSGGVRYYLMDNEWGLWHSTHRDVWPAGATMEQMRDRFCDYAGMVKGIDTDALVLGPEEWGWTGYLYSGYDAQWAGVHGWGGSYPDRTAHGNMDLMPWWLGQVAQRSAVAGRRLLDVFTLHCYPQGGEFSEDVSISMQLRRNRSTRCLWDTNYVDETWIADRVCLIPRMKNWAANYPGTAIGITEYNWGAESHMNGATAQADILGIFGREGVDLATRWTAPATNTPVARAFQIYRNYDGTNGAFGETSVRTTAPDPDAVAAFSAARAADGALTVLLVNKQLATNAPVTVAITNFAHVGVARVWQLATNAITRQPDLNVQTNRVAVTLPAQSVTLLILPAPAQLESPAAPTNRFTFQLRGEAGQRYVIENSSDLAHWSALQTNTLASNFTAVSVLRTNAWQFYRGVWLP